MTKGDKSDESMVSVSDAPLTARSTTVRVSAASLPPTVLVDVGVLAVCRSGVPRVVYTGWYTGPGSTLPTPAR